MSERLPVAHHFAFCVRKAGHRAGLARNKPYVLLPDSDAEKRGEIRIVDSSSEAHLYPSAWFVIREVRPLKAIGYWRVPRADTSSKAAERDEDWEPGLPAFPQAILASLGPQKADPRVIAYLRAGVVLHQFLGHSFCRMHCGIDSARMGSADLSDDEWLWPEGLVHYVEAHDLPLPDAFVAKALSGRPPSLATPVIIVGVDHECWNTWFREVTASVTRSSTGGYPAREQVRFVTDTATLCIFDPVALKHRLEDEADWWSDPHEELREVNAATVAFIGLGSDGAYDVNLRPPGSFEPSLSTVLSCPSGRVFLGAGEEVTSGGLEPECVRGGLFLDIDPGVYTVAVARAGGAAIDVSFQPASASKNAFNEPLHLD